MSANILLFLEMAKNIQTHYKEHTLPNTCVVQLLRSGARAMHIQFHTTVKHKHIYIFYPNTKTVLVRALGNVVQLLLAGARAVNANIIIAIKTRWCMCWLFGAKQKANMHNGNRMRFIFTMAYGI